MQIKSRNLLLLTGLSTVLPLLAGEEIKVRPLPAPQTEGGKPFMETVKQRQTIRDFVPGKLSDQVLANLLWAGYGINRPAIEHRTAPSAMNSQETDLYLALADGLFLYDAKANALKPVVSADLRGKTSSQPFGTNAAAVLIYVADLPRLAKAKPEARPLYAHFDAGCICQNVYLYCASAGLATVVYDLDRPPLAAAMALRPDQRIIFAQAVGFPKGNASESGRK
jgi:nitroreductase